jgi:hypothetical protein|tara:strand:+ start:216 stop:428 length:213 start_codon:yes stop_codon:yes gene_type:complete
MKYVLAHHCQHEDEDGNCGEMSYLHEEDEEQNRVVKVFTTKKNALQYIKDNRWSLKEVMVVPHKEGIWDE